MIKELFLMIVGALKCLLRPEMTPDQVDAVLQARADALPEKLDWKRSVVDLLKVLNLPSDYAARKQLAAELGIDGYSGTAEQNIAMHKELVAQVASRDIRLPPVEG